jgi:hypothetical protein
MWVIWQTEYTSTGNSMYRSYKRSKDARPPRLEQQGGNGSSSGDLAWSMAAGTAYGYPHSSHIITFLQTARKLRHSPRSVWV